jgi:hypothetical protein
MSYEKDPPPLADAASEAPESLRALLRSAKSDLPTPAQLAGLEAKLGPMLSGGAAPAAAPHGASSLNKAGLAVLGGLIVAGGLYLSTKPASRKVEAPLPQPVGQPSELAKPPSAAPTLPAPTVDGESVGATEEKPAGDAKQPPSRPVKSTSRPAIVAEDQLLERARQALASDPNRALALTKEHARAYPKGVLAQEREVIAIEALKRLGRTEEAGSRRGAFEEQYPESAHRRNLDGDAKTDAGK